MPTSRLRRTATIVAAAVLAAALPAAGALAALNIDPNKAKLAQVGPVSGSNGYPVWYEDKTGLRIQPCIDDTDPLCGFTTASGVPDLTKPLSFPTNWPLEVFYSLAQSSLTLAGGGKAVTTLALEGSFGALAVKDGDQVVFGRVRHVITGAPAGYYVVFHPYGVDAVQVDATGKGKFVEDVAPTPLNFTAALSSRIGPFLKWTPDASLPAGYLGNPAILHPVTGSPVTDSAGQPQNYVKVVGPLASLPADLTTATGTTTTETNFTVQGKYATDRGATGVGAYYGTDANGSFLDVYATSDPGQSIDVVGQSTFGFGTTGMVGGNGTDRTYYARVPLTAGTRPASVQVVNKGDTTPAPVTVPVTDAVTVTKAAFDATAGTLTVNATTSDPAASLTVPGYGPLTAGAATFTVGVAAPGVVTVTSSAGGKDSAPTSTVAGTGGTFTPITPIVSAGPDQSVSAGATVTLKGTLVQGDASTWEWSQVSGTGTNTVIGTTQIVTITAPTQAGTYTFRVAASNPGTPVTDDMVLTVTSSVTAPVANAGPDKTNVARGSTVTLDGSASTGVAKYSWAQVSGPVVTLANTITATPSFTFPKFNALQNPDPNAPVVIELTVTSTGGAVSKDQVSVFPAPGDTLTVTAASFRRNKGEWRIDGTSNVIAGQTVTAHLGSSVTGATIGSGVVDASGVWRIRLTGGVAPATGLTTTPITVESTLGGIGTGTATIQ